MFNPSDVTVADFEAYFVRDFIYATVWDSLDTYNVSNIVFYNITNTFYRCLNNNVTTVPTTILDWAPLPGNQYVLPSDIQKAFAEAQAALPLGVFTTNAAAEISYLYLTAHYLYSDIVANGGLSGAGIITAKSVDDVSLSYGISEIIQKSPVYSNWAQTYYGRKAITYIYPRSLARTFSVVAGRTLCC